MTKFFVGLFALVVVGLWSSSASAVLNLYEPFNYSPGQLQTDTLPSDTSVYGTAAGGHWGRAGVGNPPLGINVTSGNLTGPTALPPSVGNELSITHVLTGDGASNRMPLGNGTAVSYTANGFIYYSYLLNVTDLTNSNNGVGAFFFSFNNTTTNNEQTNNPSVQPGKTQIRIDPSDGTKYNLGVFGNEAATAGSTAWATNKLDPNVTQFIVGAVNPSTKEARLWINPDASTFGLTTAPTFTSRDTDATTWSGNNLGSVLVRQIGSLPNLTMDELRVGDSWALVTPTLSAYWDINADAGAGGTGSATPSGTWDNSAKWNLSSDGSGSTQAWPGGTYTAVFSAGTDATGAYNVAVSGPQTALGLAFEDGTPTLTGGTINLVGGKITTTGGVTATIGSVIGGNTQITLTRQGTGTAAVVLTGNETYTGATTISSGVNLTVGDGATSGSFPVASVVTDNGGLIFNRSDTVTQGTNFDSTGAGMSGTGNLTQAGSGNLVLAVANTYSGATSATAGTLTIKNTLAVQNSVVVTDAGGSVVIDPTMAGQNVTVGGLSSASTAYTAPTNMSLTINAVTANATYAPAITGTGTLTKKGTFAQTLSGTNTYSGATSVNVGTLQYTQKVAMPASSAITVNGQADWTVTSGTSTNFTGGILSVYTDDGSSGTVWSNTGSGAGTITGLINGTGGQGNSVVWNNGSSLGINIEPGLGDSITGIGYSGTIGNFHTILAGDFNHDNVVDDGDYVIWRKGGSPSPNSPSDYNAWRGNFGATGSGGTTNNVGVMKRGYGTLTLSGANTYSGQLKVNDEGGILRLTSVQTNAGQSMALPAVYIGGATTTTSSMIKVLTNNAIPTNSLIQFGTGSGGFIGILRLHDADPSVLATIPSTQSFNQTIRGISGSNNGQIQIGAGTLTIDTPTGETYSTTSRYRTDYDALGATGQHGTIIKTGAGRQDFTFSDGGGLIKGDFILQQGTLGIGNGQIFGLNSTDPTLDTNRLILNGGTLMNISGGPLNPNVKHISIGGSFAFDINGSNDSQFNGNAGVCETTLTTANPTITVIGTATTGQLIFPGNIIDNGNGYGFTKAGAGSLTLGSSGNNYSGDTIIQEGALRVRFQTNASNVGTAVIGNGSSRVVFAGGSLEYNGSASNTFNRTYTSNNGIHVAAPNDTSTIAYNSTTTPLPDSKDINFMFTSNSVDWTSGKLTFEHRGADTTAIFRPTFTGSGFNYAGPVAISTGAGGGRKTILQSTNTSGTQTWSGDITGTGSFLRDGAGGTTVLSGNNGYLGDTFVNGGILSITHAYLADTADVYLSDLTDPNAKFNLNFTGTDTIDQLFFDGTSQATGTWGSPTSGATHPSSFFTGSGLLLVSTPGSGSGFVNDTSAVPELAALSLVLLAVGPAMALRRRKR